MGRCVADFSIQDAAFSGFGVVREHRSYVFIWAGLALIVSLVLTAATIIIAGPAMTNLQALSASGIRDPATVLPLLGRLVPLYLVMTPASLVFYGVLCAAMNRAILRPADIRFAYLALGADEFRQIALLLLGFVLFAGVYILLVIGLVIAAVLLNSVAHAPPALLGFIAVVAAFTAMIWLAVRLSLASALTFREAVGCRCSSSWALTKGRFWSILGTYVSSSRARGGNRTLLTWLVILAIMAVANGGQSESDFRSAGHAISRRLFHHRSVRANRPQRRSFRASLAGRSDAARRDPAPALDGEWKRHR